MSLFLLDPFYSQIPKDGPHTPLFDPKTPVADPDTRMASPWTFSASPELSLAGFQTQFLDLHTYLAGLWTSQTSPYIYLLCTLLICSLTLWDSASDYLSWPIAPVGWLTNPLRKPKGWRIDYLNFSSLYATPRLLHYYFLKISHQRTRASESQTTYI